MDAIELVTRQDDEDGDGEWIVVRLSSGCEIHVYTDRPLVIVEPVTH